MFTDDELFLEFLREFKSTCGIPIGPRLFPLVPFTLYVFVCANVGLGCSLLKHAFDIQEIVGSCIKQQYDVVFINYYREICSIFHIA